jgi:hypothetical protein
LGDPAADGNSAIQRPLATGAGASPCIPVRAQKLG